MTVLTLVTDRRRSREPVPELCRAAARAGIDWIQVREKDLDGRGLLALARRVVASVEGTAARVLVSSRPDVARLSGAHGVQLPEDGLPVAEVKRAFPELIVGASRHDAPGARSAGLSGADFVLVGPLFASPGKESQALGEAAFAEAARAAGIPVHAIGGIDAGNARDAVRAGAAGVAAIRPFLADAEAAVHALRRALEE